MIIPSQKTTNIRLNWFPSSPREKSKDPVRETCQGEETQRRGVYDRQNQKGLRIETEELSHCDDRREKPKKEEHVIGPLTKIRHSTPVNIPNEVDKEESPLQIKRLIFPSDSILTFRPRTIRSTGLRLHFFNSK